MLFNRSLIICAAAARYSLASLDLLIAVLLAAVSLIPSLLACDTTRLKSIVEVPV